jgi:peptide/nickel transport system substrate-binding protein
MNYINARNWLTEGKAGSARRALAAGAVIAALLLLASIAFAAGPAPLAKGEEVLVTSNASGSYSGTLTVAVRTEPKTLNPVTALDGPSRDVIGRMVADLVHIDRETQQTEPALAKSWKVSADGRRYTLTLRRGIRFSDGHPFDADDVVFSFQVYMDEKVHSSQRDLLVVGDKPIMVKKLDAHHVEFELAQPYAAAERLFDSIAILPRHLLEKAYAAGTLGQVFSLTTSPNDIAGLGPFRLKQYVPGERIVLERNPYYWKADSQKQRLPYIDELVFVTVPTEDAQVIRFLNGDVDLLSRIGAENYAALEREQAARKFHVYDLGPGMEYNFLVLNQNAVVPPGAKDLARTQSWFRDVRFRQAISSGIDRDAMVRLIYRQRATPLMTHVSPANKLWSNTAVSRPQRSLDHARELLKSAGFTWAADGTLLDPGKQPVEFSIVVSASNTQRGQMATLMQADLKQLGMNVRVVPLEFRSLVDRVMQSHDYDAAIFGLAGGDVDPNPAINVLLSSGSSHLWNMGQAKPATPWEGEIDDLMHRQLTTLRYTQRKKLYDRVQQLMADNVPLVSLLTPNVLVAAKDRVKNFRPAILDHNTLWAVEELYLH